MTRIMNWKRKAALVLVSVFSSIATAQTPPFDLRGKYAQERGYWVDTSGLMWAGKDNGKDVSWGGATKYCRNLRLAGYSDWRLPTINELQDIFDKDLESPGLASPPKNPRKFTWHVEGRLFLTGDEWSSNRGLDDRGRPTGFAWYFDFNEGQPMNFDEPSAGKRAVCTRRSNE
jgi:hypothetical protein